jgi:hypothetical protein
VCVCVCVCVCGVCACSHAYTGGGDKGDSKRHARAPACAQQHTVRPAEVNDDFSLLVRLVRLVHV